jgi:hypothetical protein
MPWVTSILRPHAGACPAAYTSRASLLGVLHLGVAFVIKSLPSCPRCTTLLATRCAPRTTLESWAAYWSVPRWKSTATKF